MPPSKATSTPDRAPGPLFHFIGGKGGVGKTTCAAALGVSWSRRGHRTLIVSTDPAPSLGDALAQPLGARPRAVRGLPRLEAMEVDASASFARWLAPRRPLFQEMALRGTWLDRDDVSQLLGLALPGIDEIAALLEIDDAAASGRYDRIIVDAAPTGHMWRMLATPETFERVAGVFDSLQAHHRVVVAALRGRWAPDAGDALVTEMDTRARGMAVQLRDPQRTVIWWVTLAELLSVAETADAIRWLRTGGLAVARVVVNRVTAPPPAPCGWCDGRRRAEAAALVRLRATPGWRELAVSRVPGRRAEPRGPAALASVGASLTRAATVEPPAAAHGARRRAEPLLPVPPGAAVPELAPAPARLLVLCGKGGVGKTTCAAAAAIHAAISAPERRVLLISADPAHSLGDVLAHPLSDREAQVPGAPPNLTARELDAPRAYAAMRDDLSAAAASLAARVSPRQDQEEGGSDGHAMRELLALAPPGVDELVGVLEIMAGLDDGRQGAADLIVLDTAPTGHAQRLLEMPAVAHDWVKAIMGILLKYQPLVGAGALGARLVTLSRRLAAFRALLADPSRTRMVAVTRTGHLPRVETLRLLERLQRLALPPPLVVVNGAGGGTCARCRGERAAEAREIAVLRRALARRASARAPMIIAPAAMTPPRGVHRLLTWRRTWTALAGTVRYHR